VATEALVSDRLIRWARERDRLTKEEAAKRLRVSPDRLAQWEAGTSRPTFRQAQEVARKFHVPFGYLFLSQPPNEKSPLPDFRTVSAAVAARPSSKFTDTVQDALAKQEWYKEYRQEERADPVPFIGRYTPNDDAKTIAADISTTLGINTDTRVLAHNIEAYLRELVSRTEGAGVIVLRSGIVRNDTRRNLDVQELRGFTISDSLAPLIFINAQDSKSAQVFTLGHELCHLWINRSGISDANHSLEKETQQSTIERLCERVSAELLLPQPDFLSRWNATLPLDANVNALAAHFKVSRTAVLRHAYDLRLISRDTYWNEYPRFRGHHGATGAGGSFYPAFFARNSRTFTATLVSAVMEGRVSRRDAARLLSVRPSIVDTIIGKAIGPAEGAGG
jgi:Zn-dependent peptidase ImmA (M78 family)/DNA-binding XRE family transcriptional regulator